MNIIDVLSFGVFKFKVDSVVKAGYIDKNQDVLMRKLSHCHTGIVAIDSLERRKREAVSEKILTELKKAIRQASKDSDVIVKQADVFLKDIVDKISTELHLYRDKQGTSKEFKFREW